MNNAVKVNKDYAQEFLKSRKGWGTKHGYKEHLKVFFKVTGGSPTAVNFSPGQAAVNGLLATLSAALMASVYSWLTIRQVNPLMTARGLLAGLLVAMAGAVLLAWRKRGQK